MSLEPLPPFACWRHHTAREGSEVSYVGEAGGRRTFTGVSVAVESGRPWIVDYRIELDHDWLTRTAVVTSRSTDGSRTVRLEHDGVGHWRKDGVPTDRLDGCLDVDLESSALTNTLPVHRFAALGVGPDPVSAPAAFVRAVDVSVERLEQTYARLPDGPDGPRFDYAAPVFDVRGVLSYDRSGLVLDYPGLAVRVS